MHKRFFHVFAFTLNDLKQKMKVKETKVLLRYQGLTTR